MTVTVVGIGLIGGSMALALKEKGMAKKVIGVEANEQHAQQAMQLGLVDEIMNMEKAIEQSDLIVLAIPVNAVEQLLPSVLDKVDQQTIMDVGSIKEGILSAIENHPKRKRFVATHPMWGTEYSGPKAAVRGAFAGKATVICNGNDSDEDAVELVKEIYAQLGMHLVHMNAVEHDLHVAYISQISHITSYSLAKTGLEKER